MKKNKKLAKTALGGLLAVAVAGATFAWFTDSASIENIFKTGTFSDEVWEEFTPPTNWKPGDVTDKEVYAKNTGDIPLVVRVSFKDEWKDKDGKVIEEEEFGTEDSKKPAAILNFDNLDKDDWGPNGTTWREYEEYYYYQKQLSPNDSTEKLLESVTMNKDISIQQRTVANYYKYQRAENGEIELDDDGQKILLPVPTNKMDGKPRGTYDLVKYETMSTSPYSDATYTLTIHVELLQADKTAVEETWKELTGNDLEGFLVAVGLKETPAEPTELAA